MLGFLITEAVLGEFGLDVVPEARSGLVCLSALAVISGMATAAAVAGIVAAGLRDRSVIVVASALAAGIVIALAAIVCLLSATLRGLAIVAVTGVLSTGILVAIAGRRDRAVTMMVMMAMNRRRALSAVVLATVALAVTLSAALLTGAATLLTSAATLSATGRISRRGSNGDGRLRDTGDGRRTLHRPRVTDILSAAERNVVAGDVARVGNEARARGLDLRLVSGERIASVAGQNALQAMDGVVGIGVERAAEQLVVEACAEDSALA